MSWAASWWCGNVTDVDNYRAIALSTAVSKIFECAIADEIVNVSDNVSYVPVWI